MKKFFNRVLRIAHYELLLIFAVTLILAGCGENSQANSAEVKEEMPMKNSVTIQINEKNFSATLEDNQTARAFVKMLPLECNMTELNGNEKYFYLAEDLPNDSVRVKQIHAGDLMLFGSNCLVLFYKDFTTNYSYTPLGKLDNPADLEKFLGAGNIHVKLIKN